MMVSRTVILPKILLISAYERRHSTQSKSPHIRKIESKSSDKGALLSILFRTTGAMSISITDFPAVKTERKTRITKTLFDFLPFFKAQRNIKAVFCHMLYFGAVFGGFGAETSFPDTE